MTEQDKLWNYSNPAETEIKFREALQSISPEKNLSVYLQLQTQIARTYSLRMMFDEAHKTLEEVEKLLPAENEVAHVRYHLECGRTFNSSGKIMEAKAAFEKAEQIAIQLQEDAYTVDALHMLAIIAPQDETASINERAIIFAEESKQENAKGWLGSLYNNLGWCYFDKGEYEKALSIFLRALKWREDKKSLPEIFIAKWCVAKTLRALNRLNEALKIQLALLEEMISNNSPDGYVYEEIAEIYHTRNEEVQKMYFGFAYKELSQDKWLAKNEPARLERLKKLSA